MYKCFGKTTLGNIERRGSTHIRTIQTINRYKRKRTTRKTCLRHGSTRSTTEQNETGRATTNTKVTDVWKTDADEYRSIDVQRNDINHKPIQMNENHHNERKKRV